MRVLRRIRSLVSTHAPQPTPADGSAVVVRIGKKSIFTRALQGAVVLGAGLALTVGAAGLPQAAWATEDSAEAATEETAAAQTYTAHATSSDKSAKSADELPVVTVDAPKGALPEGAELHAELVESEKDTQAVADELEKAEVSYDGFLALDVYFADADGNEVEPTQPVDVRFELPEGALPEGAEDLAVHHLAEAEDGTVADVEAVADDADATEGTVAVQGDATVGAEFTVESFSTFTIVWGSGWSSYSVTVHYVDESGWEITGPQTNRVNADNREWIDLDEYGKSIEGHTYLGAHLGSYDGTEVRWLTNRNGTWYYSSNDSRPSSSGGSRWRNANRNVYLVYKTDESEPEIPESNATVTTGKSAVKLADGSGNYELNLSVSGDRGQVDQEQKVDVLFILDESNSMDENWGRQTRIAAAKSAISQIVGYGNNQGLSDNEALDVRFAAVGFYGGLNDEGWNDTYNDAGKLRDWTSSADELYNAIPGSLDSQRKNGGTNYEAGLMTGKEVLEGVRKDALVVTIFITDGNPGFYYNTSGETAGSSNPTSYDHDALRHAVDECKTLNTDYFYMVGVTNSVDTTVFNDMLDAVNVPGSNKGKYVASDADQLLEAFADIQKQITFFDTQGVKMTDTLSDNADLVKDDDGSYGFTLELERRENAQSGYESVASEKVNVTPGGSGTKVTLGDGGQPVEMTVFVDVDSSGKETIRVEFADDYRLAQNYRYTVSSTIAPSEAAISAFEASDTNAYDGTGDEYTGTHASQAGFLSNDNANAKVDFTPIAVDDDKVTVLEPDEAPFPKPVIQVDKSLVTPPEPVKPDLHKYVKDNNDGTYDLNLDVHGDVRVDEGDKIPVNILYVLDTSYSMIWPMDGDYYDYPDGDEDTYNNNFERMKTAQAAIEALNGRDALGDTSKFDVRYALVTFNEQVRHVDQWTSDSSKLWKANCTGGTKDFGSGTNYQEALTEARNLVATAPDDGERSDAQTIVVFLTDGEPNKPNNNAQSAAELAARQLSCDQFYAVGVGQNKTGSYRENLEGVVDNVKANDKDLYVGTESEELVEYFKNIVHQITTVNCSNVVITDTLSDYAELADGAKFSVAIRNGSGDPVAVTGGPYSAEDAAKGVEYEFTDGSDNTKTLTLTYDAQAKSFTLVFPVDYALEAGWTYTVTTQIQPTEKAFTEFAECGYDNIVGDANTDDPDGYYGTPKEEWTSSKKPGFYANSEATLTYVSADQLQEDEYPKPVIQVNTLTVSGRLKVTKTLKGHALEQNMFGFTVTPVEPLDKSSTAKESADFAGFKWDEDAQDHGVSFDNGTHKGAAGQAVGIRDGNELTIYASDAGENGKTYAYEYREKDALLDGITDVKDGQIDFDSNVYRVEVKVDNTDDEGLKATITKYVEDDNAENGWKQLDESISLSQKSLTSDKSISVDFVNDYHGYGLNIYKFIWDDKDKDGVVDEGEDVGARSGATFEVTPVESSGASLGSEVTDDKGNAHFTGLAEGVVYKVEETRVPSGYDLAEPRFIRIDSDGKAYLVEKDGSGQWVHVTGQESALPTVSGNDSIFQIKIGNKETPDLPQSGSSGTLIMSSVGVATIILAGAWLLKQRGFDLPKFTSR